MKIQKYCIWCDDIYSMNVDPAGYLAWKSGALVQDAFPDESIERREMIISGVHPKCFEDMYGEEE